MLFRTEIILSQGEYVLYKQWAEYKGSSHGLFTRYKAIGSVGDRVLRSASGYFCIQRWYNQT